MALPVLQTTRLTLREIEEGDADGHRIEAAIEAQNIASRTLAAKLGFTQEGELRDWLWVNGQVRSVLMYSLLQPEYSAGA
jgi:RimJ/RimL family protein N-acetyltransferase